MVTRSAAAAPRRIVVVGYVACAHSLMQVDKAGSNRGRRAVGDGDESTVCVCSSTVPAVIVRETLPFPLFFSPFFNLNTITGKSLAGKPFHIPLT